MLFVLLLISIQDCSSILISSEIRPSTRNITCQHSSSSTSLLFHCEACLVIQRNYAIHSLLSITGSGTTGTAYVCIKAADIEIYHENLVRECQNFPRQRLNGYDDFCVASPFNKQRGSYRACLCTTNACNWNYTECVRQVNPYWDRHSDSFKNNIEILNNRVKCYRPYEDYGRQTQSFLQPLCASNDEECKNYVFDSGVLCAISIDRSNQIFRQTLTPSIYAAKLVQLKTQICSSFTWKSRSIYFSKCQQGETICFCTIDGCDKDLETCQKSRAISLRSFFLLKAFIFILFL